MGLVVDVELLGGLYDAAGTDRTMGEWPPHPARIFCALVAGARTEEDHVALRWLEALPPPDVYASGSGSVVRKAYVVINGIASRGGSQFHPGRSNNLRLRAATKLGSPRVRVVWPSAEADITVVDRLDGMARRVPYLGRSTGVALLSCRESDSLDSVESSGLARFEPAGDGSGSLDLRVPYVGYLDQLIEQHGSNRPAWEVARTASYSALEKPSVLPLQEAMWPSPYQDVIVMSFDHQFRPDGDLAPAFTQALRRAVMSATPDPLPAALHGHDAPRRPHVAFLPLPDVGHDHAGGRLMGMAIAIPDLPLHERKAIVGGVLGAASSDAGGRSFLLEVPRLGQVSLSYRPGVVGPWALDPRRWRRASRVWSSVTPVVLDRYPNRMAIEEEIARSCLVAGLPEPNQVLVSTAPLLKGAARLRPKDLPTHLRGRLFRHVRLEFAVPVQGPVLVGSGRYLGVGLFAPVSKPPEVER